MKILIVRFSSIGDIVLTSPIPRIIKTQLSAEVHYLSKVQYLSILNNNPNIDKVYTIKKDLKEVLNRLKEENYDYIIDLHNSLRSKILKLNLRVKSYSVSKSNLKKWLMVNIKTKKITITHIVERYINTLKDLNLKNDNKGLDFFYQKDKDLQDKYSIPQSYICFSLGAKHFTKKIPNNLIKDIISKSNDNIILIGGKDVVHESERIEIESNNIINLTGKLSISQSAQIINNATLVISSDTGMMHIAAALKKKIITIWGSTIPEFGMYPYYGNFNIQSINIENKNLKCRPCSKIGFPKCPKGHFKCMEEHDINNIVDAIELLAIDP